MTLALTYEDIFVHTQKSNCVVNECRIRDAVDCFSTAVIDTQTDVSISAHPDYQLTAKETIAQGY